MEIFLREYGNRSYGGKKITKKEVIGFIKHFKYTEDKAIEVLTRCLNDLENPMHRFSLAVLGIQTKSDTRRELNIGLNMISLTSDRNISRISPRLTNRQVRMIGDISPCKRSPARMTSPSRRSRSPRRF